MKSKFEHENCVQYGDQFFITNFDGFNAHITGNPMTWLEFDSYEEAALIVFHWALWNLGENV